MKRSTRSMRPGFSLIEIIIVVIILAIAAAIVIPSIGSAADTQAISAARIIESDMAVARSLALTSQVPHTVLFSDDRQSYKVVANYAGQAYGSVVAVPHPVVAGRRYETVLAGGNGMGSVRVIAASFGGAAYVTFNSQGDPSAGGTITLQAGQTQMQVTVQALTGSVSVARTAG
jgi:general secretion pathway protein H